MRRKGGEGGYERRRFTKEGDYHSTGDFIGGGFSWIWREESLSSVVGRISTGGTGLLGVLGTGARISIWYPGARKLS
jgi:hypothetical protein